MSFELETPIGKLTGNLQAAKSISSYAGGFVEAARRVMALDAAMLTFIAAAGLGKPPDADVESLVFDAGVVTLQLPLSEYLERLANGGRPIAAGEQAQ